MLKIGLWDTRTIYYYVIYIHWLVSGVMSGGAYNEHILSIYSAYIEHILKARGRSEEGTRKERGKIEEGAKKE